MRKLIFSQVVLDRSLNLQKVAETMLMRHTRIFLASKVSKFSGLSPSSVRPASVTTLSRTHYTYADPGHFHTSNEQNNHHRHNWKQRGFTVGIGGPVGSGKTALVLALTRRLAEKVPREYYIFAFAGRILFHAIILQNSYERPSPFNSSFLTQLAW